MYGNGQECRVEGIYSLKANMNSLVQSNTTPNCLHHSNLDNLSFVLDEIKSEECVTMASKCFNSNLKEKPSAVKQRNIYRERIHYSHQ